MVMATLSSAGISGSGLDETMIAKLVALQRQSLVPLQQKASVLDSKISTFGQIRSEEHTSELQSHLNLVCRLLLEKKKKKNKEECQKYTHIMYKKHMRCAKLDSMHNRC